MPLSTYLTAKGGCAAGVGKSSIIVALLREEFVEKVARDRPTIKSQGRVKY